MMHALPLLAAALSASAPKTFECKMRLMGPELPSAFASIEVDEGHAVLKAPMWYSARDFKAVWDARNGTLDETTILTRLDLDAFALPHDVAFPVTLAFTVDGLEVANQKFDEPNVLIAYTEDGLIPSWAGPRRAGQFHPGVQLELKSEEPFKLFGAKDAQLVATSSSGERIGALQLPLPEWDELARLAREAFIQLEQQRMRRGCELQQPVIVTSGHGSKRRR